MRFLFLISPLRCGSHMVRSMLANDPGIVISPREHIPFSEITMIDRPETTLICLKYGFGGFLHDCVRAAEIPDACALFLWRNSRWDQARSLLRAQKTGEWVTPIEGSLPVEVTAEQVRRIADRNLRDLLRFKDYSLPHAALCYEDITVGALKTKMDRLLGRDVLVTAPTTAKIAPT